MKKKLVASLIVTLILMTLFVQTAFAAKSFSYTTVMSGQTYVYDKTTTWSSADATGMFRYLYYDYKYKGSTTHFTNVKATSGNYYHYKGYADLQATNCITQTWQVTTSVNIAGTYGASLGYSYSYASSTSVSSTINPTSASGYYYFGVKFRLRDFKVTEYTYYQHFVTASNYWETLSSSSATYYGTRVDWTGSGSTPLYYAWYAA